MCSESRSLPRTPVLNLILIACIGLIGQFLTIGDATSLINFGAFLAFTVANICVFVLWVKNRDSMSVKDSLVGFIIIPVLGVFVDLYLLFHLSPLALTVGGTWLVIGVVYLAFLTKGFRRPPPGLDIENVERGSDVEGTLPQTEP